MYKTIGVMTGNSLDAVDVVLTEFNDNKMTDLCGYSQDITQDIEQGFRRLKAILIENDGDINEAVKQFDFKTLHDNYIKNVAEAVNKLLKKSGFSKEDIDSIGFHGQTCAHCPPSVAKTRDKSKIYTLQIGSGQMLADLTGIPVVFDFRSDDLMNQGEGAPLAPVHNRHIADSLGISPIAFCNAGNTGNIAVISQNTTGWDTGPFNNFIDMLCREEKGLPYDEDGKLGAQGKINYELLEALFDKSAITKDGDNFLEKSPPKSSDPSWYKTIPEMKDNKISFEDRLRTVEFFSAYCFAYNLSHISGEKPKYFLIFGGGWKNPVVLKDFKDLISGKAKVLDKHIELFNKIKIKNPIVKWSDKYGYSGQYMEARIFADMAKCFLTKEPFSYPETTGCSTPTIGGILTKPNAGNSKLWSRAAKGWYNPAD